MQPELWRGSGTKTVGRHRVAPASIKLKRPSHDLFSLIPLPQCRPKVCPLLAVHDDDDAYIWPTAIREFDAKLLLAYWLERAPAVSKSATISPSFVYPAPKVAQISWDAETGAITPDTQLPPWVFTTKLVAKPDQLIKRRGKAGLLALNKTWSEAKQWIQERAGKAVKVRH